MASELLKINEQTKVFSLIFTIRFSILFVFIVVNLLCFADKTKTPFIYCFKGGGENSFLLSIQWNSIDLVISSHLKTNSTKGIILCDANIHKQIEKKLLLNMRSSSTFQYKSLNSSNYSSMSIKKKLHI